MKSTIIGKLKSKTGPKMKKMQLNKLTVMISKIKKKKKYNTIRNVLDWLKSKNNWQMQTLEVTSWTTWHIIGS